MLTVQMTSDFIVPLLSSALSHVLKPQDPQTANKYRYMHLNYVYVKRGSQVKSTTQRSF